jgi:hypothetical protein
MYQKTKRASDLVNLTKPEAGTFLLLGESLQPDSRFRPVDDLSSQPNVYSDEINDQLLVIRVFSPSNASGIANGTVGQKYDFMVAVTAPKFFTAEQEAQVKDKVKGVFDKYLYIVLFLSAFFIVLGFFSILWS